MNDINHTKEVRQLFENTRRKLVDTGTRNRLVHVNRQNKRSNSLEIINERSDDIYRILMLPDKKMRFLAAGKDDKTSDDTISLAYDAEGSYDESRFTDDQLETPLGPELLQKRLLKIARMAKTAEEEQGVNILFLAMGFLTWFEADTSDVKREAPLLLLPVELVRHQKRSTYELRSRDDDISTNLCLQERLKADFGIDLPDIQIDDGWTPGVYFRMVQDAISHKVRWQIDQNGMQLGFFSFAKILMFRDLDPKNWPDNALEQHALTIGLLHKRFKNEDPVFNDSDRLDEKLPPETLFHVVDADSSQAKVIEEVRRGCNLIVQGPPGTGKSQTITNMIAAAVKDGKRVLFIAEKMAALSVVHKRLVNVGLSNICLELHSKSANKKAVLAELAKTLNAAQSVPSMSESPHQLKETMDKLNAITRDLHSEVGHSGISAFKAIARQIYFKGQSTPAPMLSIDGIENIHDEAAKQLGLYLQAYGLTVNNAGTLRNHPFFGVKKLDLQPTDLERLKNNLDAFASTLAELFNTTQTALNKLGIEVPLNLNSARALADQLAKIGNVPSLDSDTLKTLLMLSDKTRLKQHLEAGLLYCKARQANDETFHDAAWKYDASILKSTLASGQNSFFAFLRRWGSSYRHASRELGGLLKNPLPKSAKSRIELVDCLISISKLHDKWRSDQDWGSRNLADQWRGDKTAFAELLNATEWAHQASSASVKADPECIIQLAHISHERLKLENELKIQTEEAMSFVLALSGELNLDLNEAFGSSDILHSSLCTVKHKAQLIKSNINRYEEWVELQRLQTLLQKSGLGKYLPLLESGKISGSAVKDEFHYARAEAIWKKAFADNPTLGKLRNLDRHELVRNFQKLETGRRHDCAKEILLTHLNHVPRGAQGEMGFLRGEIGKKKSHSPIRKLFSKAGKEIQAIKPVLMMSPISVAQFLPPNMVGFDLLLIDEASQIRPEDALGAISRAQQIVVVGDQKQLPPSSFFDRITSDEEIDDEDDNTVDLLEGVAKVDELESILTLCEARGLSSRMLKWHYRSRDPSLIRVSNLEFYGDELILPPSPLQNDPDHGLKFTHVRGFYDRGGKRNNRIEAEAIIDRVAQHAIHKPEQSLGIVTFSVTQANLVTELLEYRRRQDDILDGFLREGQSEDVFVKNIENVQGDERDVILVSVGYGPSAEGQKPGMNFGPVNSEGGERRLNVLFTRARVQCEVFCSFDPGQMDLSKTRMEGPRVLKKFLEFAKTGIVQEKNATGAEPDTPFEADIADEIRKLGFLVDHQVGTAGFLIDLGVRHPDQPGTYILAVECDGATYHSALWARERDRLRQEVLEKHGWIFHRIWSTDWFYRRADELERLQNVLKKSSDISITDTGLGRSNKSEFTKSAYVMT